MMIDDAELLQLGVRATPNGFLLDKTIDRQRYRFSLGPHRGRAMLALDRFHINPEEFVADRMARRAMRDMPRLVADYLKESKSVRRNAKSYVALQRQTLERFLPYGPRDAQMWKLLHVARYMEHRSSGGIGVNTQRTEAAVIRSFFRWMFNNKNIRRDPTMGLVMPRAIREMRNRTQQIPAPVLLKLKPHLSPHDYAAVAVMWACGLRSGEVSRITERDIDEERMRLWVKNRKGKKGHATPIPDDAILGYLYVIMAVAAKRPTVMKHLSRRLGNAIRRAGVRRFTPHDLRHACLTRWAEEGVSPFTIKEWAGHSSIKITMKYIHSLKHEHEKLSPSGL